MTYQLVLQLPASSIADYDRMLKLEEQIIEGLGDLGDVDGHDMGEGEANIFVLTDEPRLVFERIRMLVGTQELMRDLRAAYREVGASNFTIVHPSDLTRFRVA